MAARLLVGRSPGAALRIDDPHVSGEHATLVWTGRGWEVRDLGSRNGTFLGDERLAPGTPKALTAGARLAFGNASDVWVFEDDAPPDAFAIHLGSGRVRRARDGQLALPDDVSPEVVAYTDRAGGWVVEVSDADPRPAADGEVLVAGGVSWRLFVPESQPGTATLDGGAHIDTVQLRFRVSRDEEHVELGVVHRGRETRLEAREHAYVLLTLARLRLQDASMPPSEQGWVDRDRLLRMLGLDTNGLNVAIYRARGHLAKAGVDGSAGIVEVRRGQRRIGLEPERLLVEPL